MVRSQASTATAYLAALPPNRRRELAMVRRVIRQHLPKGYQEAMAAGMITYQVPFRRYSSTYNGQPLWYAALAAQKNYLTLHLMVVYMNPPLESQLRAGFERAGKKLNMGKACIRFQRAEDLALEVVGQVIASTQLEAFVAVAEAARRK
jgi:hypothetical protein